MNRLRTRPGAGLWWIPACLMLVCAVPALAADPEGVSLQEHKRRLQQPLSLDDAVTEALQYNTAVRAARARVAERRGQRRHAGRLVPSNPRVEASVADRQGLAESHSDMELRVSQELWIGGQGGLAEASAEARLQSAGARLDYLETAHAARTRRAFLLLLWARESVASAERLVEVNRRLSGYVQRRVKAGESTAIEANTAAIGLSRARAELETARNTLERQRLDLAERLSRDPAAPLQVTGDLAPWTLDLPSEDELLSRAAAQRQDLVAAGRSVEAARRELELSRRQLIPNLTVFGLYKEESDFEISGAGVSLELPLLHRYGGERQAARARLEQRRIDEQALRLRVRREVLTALSDYRSAAERVRLLGEETLRQAEENVGLLQTALEAGEVGAPAVTSAQNNLIEVRDSYLAALREQVEAAASLERATGGLVRVGNALGTDSTE